VDADAWAKFVDGSGLSKKHLDRYHNINPFMDIVSAASLLEELLKDLDALGALGLPRGITVSDVTVRSFAQKTSVRGYQYDQINICLSNGAETVFTMDPQGPLGGAEMDSPQMAGLLGMLDGAVQRVSQKQPGRPLYVGLAPNSLALSPNGSKAFIACEEEDAVMILDLSQGVPLQRIKTHETPTSIAVTSDGKIGVVAAHSENAIDILDLEAGARIRTLPVKIDMPSEVKISPDDNTIVVGGYDQMLFYNMVTNTRSVIDRDEMGSFVFHPDGDRLYCLEHKEGWKLSQLDLESKKITQRIPIPARMRKSFNISISPDGQHILITGDRSTSIARFDVDKGSFVDKIKVPKAQFGLEEIAFSPDSTKAYVLGMDHYVFPIDLKTGKLLPEIGVPQRLRCCRMESTPLLPPRVITPSPK
jgi:DNA-binding beta-propeller fold protein YncE